MPNFKVVMLSKRDEKLVRQLSELGSYQAVSDYRQRKLNARLAEPKPPSKPAKRD